MIYQGDKILVKDKIGDKHWKGITFLGGHVEKRERAGQICNTILQRLRLSRITKRKFQKNVIKSDRRWNGRQKQNWKMHKVRSLMRQCLKGLSGKRMNCWMEKRLQGQREWNLKKNRY